MSKYQCIRKCRHGKRYNPGDIAEFNTKPPGHFIPIDQTKPKTKSPAKKTAHKPPRHLVGKQSKKYGE